MHKNRAFADGISRPNFGRRYPSLVRTLPSDGFSNFETAAWRRHFAYETLGRYISKMVRARAFKFYSFVVGINLYLPDFFQIFPAKIVSVKNI